MTGSTITMLTSSEMGTQSTRSIPRPIFAHELSIKNVIPILLTHQTLSMSSTTACLVSSITRQVAVFLI